MDYFNSSDLRSSPTQTSSISLDTFDQVACGNYPSLNHNEAVVSTVCSPQPPQSLLLPQNPQFLSDYTVQSSVHNRGVHWPPTIQLQSPSDCQSPYAETQAFSDSRPPTYHTNLQTVDWPAGWEDSQPDKAQNYAANPNSVKWSISNGWESQQPIGAQHYVASKKHTKSLTNASWGSSQPSNVQHYDTGQKPAEWRNTNDRDGSQPNQTQFCAACHNLTDEFTTTSNWESPQQAEEQHYAVGQKPVDEFTTTSSCDIPQQVREQYYTVSQKPAEWFPDNSTNSWISSQPAETQHYAAGQKPVKWPYPTKERVKLGKKRGRRQHQHQDSQRTNSALQSPTPPFAAECHYNVADSRAGIENISQRGDWPGQLVSRLRRRRRTGTGFRMRTYFTGASDVPRQASGLPLCVDNELLLQALSRVPTITRTPRGTLAHLIVACFPQAELSGLLPVVTGINRSFGPQSCPPGQTAAPRLVAHCRRLCRQAGLDPMIGQLAGEPATWLEVIQRNADWRAYYLRCLTTAEMDRKGTVTVDWERLANRLLCEKLTEYDLRMLTAKLLEEFENVYLANILVSVRREKVWAPGRWHNLLMGTKDVSQWDEYVGV